MYSLSVISIENPRTRKSKTTKCEILYTVHFFSSSVNTVLADHLVDQIDPPKQSLYHLIISGLGTSLSMYVRPF